MFAMEPRLHMLTKDVGVKEQSSKKKKKQQKNPVICSYVCQNVFEVDMNTKHDKSSCTTSDILLSALLKRALWPQMPLTKCNFSALKPNNDSHSPQMPLFILNNHEM